MSTETNKRPTEFNPEASIEWCGNNPEAAICYLKELTDNLKYDGSLTEEITYLLYYVLHAHHGFSNWSHSGWPSQIQATIRAIRDMPVQTPEKPPEDTQNSIDCREENLAALRCLVSLIQLATSKCEPFLQQFLLDLWEIETAPIIEEQWPKVGFYGRIYRSFSLPGFHEFYQEEYNETLAQRDILRIHTETIVSLASQEPEKAFHEALFSYKTQRHNAPVAEKLGELVCQVALKHIRQLKQQQRYDDALEKSSLYYRQAQRWLISTVGESDYDAAIQRETKRFLSVLGETIEAEFPEPEPDWREPD